MPKAIAPYDRAEIISANQRPYIKKARCQRCGRAFQRNKNGWKHTFAMVAEEETSIMRGDDIVHFFHLECWEVRNA